ncbi:NAD(P)/FAD-dependent oxidoreductase [Luteimonas sp. A478]
MGIQRVVGVSNSAGFDLIVVGAGIIGAACAEQAVVDGLSVAIVEHSALGGGSTAASMGHLVAMDDEPSEFALCRYSLELWNSHGSLEVAEYRRCGTLWVAAGEQDAEAIPPKLARLEAAGVRAQTVTGPQLRELEPELAPGMAGGLLVPDESIVYPPRAVQWMLDRCLRSRAVLYQGRSVVRLRPGGVLLDDGSRLDGQVLLATGLATAALVPALAMAARKGHLVVTDRHPGRVRHQVLEVGYADSAQGEEPVSVAFNVQPRPTGQLLIGSSREDSAGDDVNLPVLRRMVERACGFMPGLRALQAIRVWTGLRPRTPDGRPYIGAVPEQPGVWVAAGHEGLGVSMALGTARLLCDLLGGRSPAIDPAPYDPARRFA